MAVSGIIAVPTPVIGRYTSFWQALSALTLPAGAEVKIGRGCSPAENRNGLIQIARDAGAAWIYFLDDDLVFHPDSLTRLLKHLDTPEVEAVVGLSFLRQDPSKALWLRDGEMLTDLPAPGGLLPLHACTFGGLLVRMSAIAKITPPYVTLGQCDELHQTWGDDTYFCKKLREAGVTIYGDSSVRFGHTTDLEVWPHYAPETGWSVVFARSLEPVAVLPWGAQTPVTA